MYVSFPHITCKCHPPTSVVVYDHLLRGVSSDIPLNNQTNICWRSASLSLRSISVTSPSSSRLALLSCVCVWEGHCSSSWLHTRVRSGDGARETRGGLLKHFRIWWRGEDNYINLVILKNAIILSKSRILQQTQCGRWKGHLIALQLNKTNMLEMRTFL